MRLSHIPVLKTSAWGYVWIFRSIPMIVQLVPVAQCSVERRYARGTDRTPPPAPPRHARRAVRDLSQGESR
ncbi:hypothetical protein ABZ615_17970 [Streptomyces sp. NPDC007325]|uniref:hypothetical protein n=1 Tax=Streptomyces sp. NPDC007325 TaxID=3154588 RepID=UPI0033CD7314